MKPAIVEHLVIGGGPAGSMVALRLGGAGRAVTLVERERGAHDKVCGEFLSREAVAYLAQVGLELASLGAVAIDRVRLGAGNRVVEATLPFRAFSLSRRVLDEAMLARAQAMRSDVRRGLEVTAVDREDAREGDLWRVTMRDGAVLRARHVFLATGKHEVRGWVRGAGRHADLVGFKMHWRLRPAQTEALRGVMELFLLRDGYGGLSLVEGDTATLCFVIRRACLQALRGWPDLLAAVRGASESLAMHLEGAQALWERPLAIAPIPYGWMAQETDALWRVGDQAAVIPSFTGDGMSIALHSAALAAQMFLDGRSAQAYGRALRAQLRGSMRLATLVSRAMV
ncbi:MAG: FAD-dependent monooxygenase, partial [Terracidiphilus sp.]